MKKIAVLLMGCALGASVMADQINITSNYLGGLGDDVVSPHCLTGNVWDLEAFLLDGTNLTLVGSYDLKNGYSGTYLGDIFIDLNGDAKNYGLTGGANSTTNFFNFPNSYTLWDYAIKLNYATGTFTAYTLTNNSQLSSVEYVNWYQNANGNPVSLVVGAEQIACTGAFIYQSGLADNAALGYTGWGSGTTSHNAITLDIACLLKPGDNNLVTHTALSCGNDVLVGKTTIRVPEPSSISLLFMGIGLLGAAGMIRRRKK